jgi:predicted DNA-binding transcriptional regulator AlpA
MGEALMTTTDAADVTYDGLADIHEAAEFLSLSRSTLYEMMDNGNLP